MIDRYSRLAPSSTAIWSDASRFALLARHRAGGVRGDGADGPRPAGTAAQVRAQGGEGKLDPARILTIEATTRHDVIAFLTHVEELAGAPARWLHLGMTSSDVLDTRWRCRLRARARRDPGAASTAWRRRAGGAARASTPRRR
jgi:adenylosuccinate lyase